MGPTGLSVITAFCAGLDFRKRQREKAEVGLQYLGWLHHGHDADLLLDSGAWRGDAGDIPWVYFLCGQTDDHHHSDLGNRGDRKVQQFGVYFRQSCEKEQSEKGLDPFMDPLPEIYKDHLGFFQ